MFMSFWHIATNFPDAKRIVRSFQYQMCLQDLKPAPGCPTCFVALQVNIFIFVSSVCCVLMLQTMFIIIYYGSQETHQGVCREQNL